MTFCTFDLIAKKESVQIDINPVHIEALVDGSNFDGNPKCTQIILTSGTKVFVTQTIVEIREVLQNI